MATDLSIPVLDAQAEGFETRLDTLLTRSVVRDPEFETRVRSIIDEVRRDGDAALLRYTRQFDEVGATSVAQLELQPARIAAAVASIGSAEREALSMAQRRIHEYHGRQLETSWEYADEHGNVLGQQIRPLQRVGLYVPGGKASYPSSVLMTAIPARVAGVTELIMVVPAPRGELNDLVLAAAQYAGVDRIFTVGGAQAIAALAYGTKTMPAVDKIVGPGNAYVAAAKRMVFGQVGIDMIAGPSEVVVVCDHSADPDWVAMDLFAQAEHDEQAQAIMISDNAGLVDAVSEAMRRLLPGLPRREIIRHALNRHGAIIRVRDRQQAVAIVNRIAPEHLELAVEDPQELLPGIENAGAIFVGAYSAESLGDYVAGPNHVLPTSGTARFSSPLGVYDFQKRSSVIRCSPQGAASLAGAAAVLARSEQLHAHALSAEYRTSPDPK
ncbi:MAG: histidinol dehydrogenase [Gammaproteobacteria bacterium]|nr:histidinol dehydrogenase [Gammaproteobacteria bacterium]